MYPRNITKDVFYKPVLDNMLNSLSSLYKYGNVINDYRYSKQGVERPNKLYQIIKSSKLPTYYVRSGGKKSPGVVSYYKCENYPLSPLNPRFLALIEQYLHDISDLVYSVHQS